MHRVATYSKLKRNIFEKLYYEKELTCSDLSALLGKSIPLVARTLAELTQEGIVVPRGHADSTGGRKALLYQLKSQTVYILSVAMDQLYTTISVMDAGRNEVVYSKQVDLKLLGNNEALAALVALITATLEDSGIRHDQLLGIGLGMPGFINIKKGVNQSYVFTNSSLSLRDYLQQTFNMPVFIDNDSSTIALGEAAFGRAKGKTDVMVINISWGVGLGMIMNGRPFRGHAGYAGELSHIPIADNDIICECGKRGCLETEASLRVVALKALELADKGKLGHLKLTDRSIEATAYAVMEFAAQGDQLCIELLSDMAYKIGKALAILVHIINPELVLLSGRASAVGKLLMAPVQQALNTYSIPRLMEGVELDYSTLQYNAYSMGAAALVVNSLSAANADAIKETDTAAAVSG
ncbi:ROK family protein [Niabella beijingensis]|uniref:ROK family protein n=1 Tax=Niabella beijingensis TaxID=2872700 RepID=UPI001CBFC5D9|nr:ROK family protein [Niabella beijingensis]MBZ4187326.1 ROK family protein [Niabella beijingensis]